MNLPDWVKSLAFAIIATLSLYSVQAQKKLVPITESALTGLLLPAGSKQDNRMLMKASGRVLMEMEAKKVNTTISKTEILYLPASAEGADAVSIVQRLSAMGWTITPVQTDEKYAWMQKDNRYIIIYFSPEKKDNNLYFGEVNTAPMNAGNGNNYSDNQNGNNNNQENSQPADQQTAGQNQEPAVSIPVNNSSTANPSTFAFTSTNFDDGWQSTAKEDWVEVTKDNIKVLLHYPKEGTIFPADPEPLTNAAWNILVAPRYSDLKNYKTSYISDYDRPYLGMGYATENATGKNVFVLLFRKGSTGWLEFVSPDKNSFIQQFKFDPESIRYDSESGLLSPLVKMVNYNKFSVAASDLQGKWTSDFTGIQQLYSLYTGEYVGMHMNQSSQTFQFGTDNTYNWEILVVSGMAGNAKATNVKSSGKFSVPNNWQLDFSDIEGRPKLYDAYFTCIKAARMLWINDAKNPGSGIFTGFGLAK